MHAGCVCESGELRAALREDLDAYIFGGNFGRLTSLSVVLQSQGLWATTAYRLKHYVRHRLHSRLLGVPLLAFQRIVIALTGIDIDSQAHIGPGLLIPHGGYIVIGSVQIGRNCNIHQGVTLGERVSTLEYRTSKPPLPTLGDRVWVGPGAVVAGDVAIGDDASVGANSLVVRDVPPRGVVLGVPARLVSRHGSFTQVRYREMDNDDERKASLAADSEAGPLPAQ
jgi:serine O-acetyltransferase